MQLHREIFCIQPNEEIKVPRELLQIHKRICLLVIYFYIIFQTSVTTINLRCWICKIKYIYCFAPYCVLGCLPKYTYYLVHEQYEWPKYQQNDIIFILAKLINRYFHNLHAYSLLIHMILYLPQIVISFTNTIIL